jgi:hypothetical protein
VPVIWNAPGVDYEDLPAWADPLMKLAFSASSYIAVRDEPSRAALARFADPDRLAVVPDTAFGLARPMAVPPTPELERIREAGPYIVIQGARNLGVCQRFLKRHADRLRGYRLLALPIGPVNSDDTAVLDPGLPGLETLPSWPHPLRPSIPMRGRVRSRWVNGCAGSYRDEAAAGSRCYRTAA